MILEKVVESLTLIKALRPPWTNLFKAGLGKWENVPAGAKGGRPTRIFVLTEHAPVTEPPSNTGENGGFSYGNGNGEGNSTSPHVEDDNRGDV